MASTGDIALYGHSGAGKTTVADWLVSNRGFVHCATGAACRGICQMLFQSESKTLLNQVTDALKAIDEHVWLRAALSENVVGKPVVFDSMRFLSDYRFLRERGFSTWKITAPLEVRVGRLRARGQEFNPDVDDRHRGETELAGSAFDVVIDNGGSDLPTLYEAVATALGITSLHDQ
jgi:dephospho-CoA kinase